MKKIIVIAFMGMFFASCGPKRYGCGPYRRCEVKLPTTINSDINTSQIS